METWWTNKEDVLSLPKRSSRKQYSKRLVLWVSISDVSGRGSSGRSGLRACDARRCVVVYVQIARRRRERNCEETTGGSTPGQVPPGSCRGPRACAEWLAWLAWLQHKRRGQ